MWAETEGGWRCRQNSKSSSWQTTAHRQNVAHLFVSIKFYWNTATLICVCIFYGCSHMKVQNCVVMTDSIAHKAKILTFCRKKCVDPALDTRACRDIPFFFSFCFLGPHLQHMEVPRQGVESELQLPAYVTARAIQDPAASATYTTTHGNARSLTHWVRPGFEPATSWFLVGFISTAPRPELQDYDFKVEINGRERKDRKEGVKFGMW